MRICGVLIPFIDTNPYERLPNSDAKSSAQSRSSFKPYGELLAAIRCVNTDGSADQIVKRANDLAHKFFSYQLSAISRDDAMVIFRELRAVVRKNDLFLSVFTSRLFSLVNPSASADDLLKWNAALYVSQNTVT